MSTAGKRTRSIDVQRRRYPHFERRQTRWLDTDGQNHINNVVFYAMMDDAVNAHLIPRGVGFDHPRFVAESGCVYHHPIAYPADVDVGLRVERLGRSSVVYEIGLFGLGVGDGSGEVHAATGKFVHVYVDAEGRPREIDTAARAVLSELRAETRV